MARFTLKFGDVFSIKIENNLHRYFQYVANDITQLNSEVIRVFKTDYLSSEEPTIEEIVLSEIDFYSHVISKVGVKMGVWDKVGNSKTTGAGEPWFRISDDSGNLSVIISKKWRVWKIGKKMKNVGKLPKEMYDAEIGMVVNPYALVDRINLGRYDFVYPKY